MLNYNRAVTPTNINEKLRHEDGAEMVDTRRFKSLVGGLIYLMHTRPNIAFTVGIIYRFMEHPSKVHYGARKRVTLCCRNYGVIATQKKKKKKKS